MRRYALDELTETLTKAALAKALEAETARREVLPFIGEAHGENADDLYRAALEQCGVDLRGIPPDHYRSMLRMVSPDGKLKKPLGMDAASRASFAQQFPAIARIKKV
jgi:hypothetical protein